MIIFPYLLLTSEDKAIYSSNSNTMSNNKQLHVDHELTYHKGYHDFKKRSYNIRISKSRLEMYHYKNL